MAEGGIAGTSRQCLLFSAAVLHESSGRQHPMAAESCCRDIESVKSMHMLHLPCVLIHLHAGSCTVACFLQACTQCALRHTP